jgi:hypothetical protein
VGFLSPGWDAAGPSAMLPGRAGLPLSLRDMAMLRIAPIDRVTRARLLEWALIEPDVPELRSTRRNGAPITWLKRPAWRSLQQYLNEMTYQQSRFNMRLIRRVFELEDRIEELESGRRVGGQRHG